MTVYVIVQRDEHGALQTVEVRRYMSFFSRAYPDCRFVACDFGEHYECEHCGLRVFARAVLE